MVTEGAHYTDYDPQLRSRLLGEAARVVRSFGFAGSHVIIIGGLVPSLLVPIPEPGLPPHVGTLDLDVCLGVALVEGDVGAYERLEKSLRDAGFAMCRDEDGNTVSWRWEGGVGVRLTIEFFCAPKEGREPGRLYRPKGAVGNKLSAMTIAAGQLIDRDAREVSEEVDLPDGGGRTEQRFKVVGPAAYLAAKADALRRREKNKDAYDVVWLSECWPGAQGALADEIRKSAVFDELGPSLDILAQEFANPDAAGSTKYARFMAVETAERDRAAQHAVGAMRALMKELGHAASTP